MKEYERLYQLCKKRHSVRKFADHPVHQDDIQRILTLAATSPYASGRKNWKIKVVNDMMIIHQLGDEVRNAVYGFKSQIRDDFTDEFIKYSQNFMAFESAPVLLILTYRVAPTLSLLLSSEDPVVLEWERDSYVKSISCVAMLILLAAESLGLASCYMTGPLIAEKRISKLIQIGKGQRIGAFLPIGYEIKDG